MLTKLTPTAGLALALLVLPATAGPQVSVVKKIEFRAIASVNGKDVYKAYCVYCHGEDGKGHGPQAQGLRKAPADLTTIASRNGGKFEAGAIEDKINGWNKVPKSMTDAAAMKQAMDTGQNVQDVPVMPLFGPLFAKLYPQEIRDRQVRMANLIRFIRSIQEKPAQEGVAK
jgi:mono/diheme cytochrome c family protein